MGCYVETAETYLKLALRAQSQCRATLETLSNIKNPPLAGYVKQANIVHGPQQVVNHASPGSGGAASAHENVIPQNKLLEKDDGQRLDAGTAQAAIRADSAMETVGAIDRTANGHR